MQRLLSILERSVCLKDHQTHSLLTGVFVVLHGLVSSLTHVCVLSKIDLRQSFVHKELDRLTCPKLAIVFLISEKVFVEDPII